MAIDRRRAHNDVWAVVPIKETAHAKQRLAGALSARLRQELAAAMFEDVIRALAETPGLAGIAVVTLDPTASGLALGLGAEVWTEGARTLGQSWPRRGGLRKIDQPC